MRWTYSCPHCRAMLNPEGTVILIGAHGGTTVLVGFDPKPGSYRAYLPPGVEAEQGEEWIFACPLCREPLTTGEAPELCALDMVVEGVPHRVYFSRIAGDCATFVISAEGIERHGPHHARHSLELLEQI